MKILQTKKSKKIIETIRHKTDIGVDVVETIINKKHVALELSGKDKELTPVFFDEKKAFLKTSMKKFLDPHYAFVDYINDHKKEISSIDFINLYPIYHVFYSGWVLFDQNKRPISLPYATNYIGSLKEKRTNDPIYKELIAKLKKHPFVLSLEEEEIPYYNHEFSGQKGISWAVMQVSQEKYEELYKHYKEHQFWSVGMHDAIKMNYDTTVNVYGDEIWALLKEHWKYEE
jgi:hypothetical protein